MARPKGILTAPGWSRPRGRPPPRFERPAVRSEDQCRYEPLPGESPLYNFQTRWTSFGSYAPSGGGCPRPPPDVAAPPRPLGTLRLCAVQMGLPYIKKGRTRFVPIGRAFPGGQPSSQTRANPALTNARNGGRTRVDLTAVTQEHRPQVPRDSESELLVPPPLSQGRGHTLAPPTQSLREPRA